MQTKQVLTVLCLIGLAITVEERIAVAQAPAVDNEALAQTIVTQNARVTEGDRVLITGSARDLELLENIAVHVRKAGAWPMIQLGSERLIKRMFDDVPAEYDSQAPELALALADVFTVWIDVPLVAAPDLLTHVAPARFAAQGAAFEPVGQLWRERNIRFVELGNGLYPTAWRARRFGISESELADLFWAGVNVDYAELQQTGEAFSEALSGGDEVRLTNPNGTDLRMRIQGRPIYVSDGVISAEDEQQGGAAVQAWLPAGEVYLTPVAGSASGTIVVERDFYQDQEIRGLRLTFADGRLSSMTAESGLERFQALYDAAGAGKDVFGLIDIGINSEVRIPEGSRLAAFSPAGIVTVGFGDNTWAGGDNVSNFGWSAQLPGSTLTVDGVPLVENGALKQ
ncbi:hypothetical protein BH18GEM1_BH18GEM1_16910 [soil metagenome]